MDGQCLRACAFSLLSCYYGFPCQFLGVWQYRNLNDYRRRFLDISVFKVFRLRARVGEVVYRNMMCSLKGTDPKREMGSVKCQRRIVWKLWYRLSRICKWETGSLYTGNGIASSISSKIFRWDLIVSRGLFLPFYASMSKTSIFPDSLLISPVIKCSISCSSDSFFAV